MLVPPPPFGIVIPVRNEAVVLRETLPPLLKATENIPARLVWVCNDCSDDSAQVIRSLAGRDAEIVILHHPGKTLALQAGDDALGTLFPRFYLDADITLSPGALPELLRPLLDGRADLVSPRRVHETNKVSRISTAMARTWDALPHAQFTGYLGALGLSEAGRNAWGRWPLVLADDVFVAAKIAANRRLILTKVTASTWPPTDFGGWVSMRARWLRGEEQLRMMGLEAPRAPGQRSALMRQLFSPSHAVGAWAFAFARLIAPLVSARLTYGWRPDRRGWL